MTTPGDILNAVVRSIAPVSVAHADAARCHVAGLPSDRLAGPLNVRADTGHSGTKDRTGATAPASAQSSHSDGGQVDVGTAPKVHPDGLARLAARLAGAQHTARPIAKQRFLIVVAGDHGRTAPLHTGARHPTVVAAHAIADGTGVLAQVARMSQTPIILVDAGGSESDHFPRTAIALAAAPTHRTGTSAAMTIDDAFRSLEAGIALAVSLSEQASKPPPHSPIDSAAHAGGARVALLALGAIGIGSEVAAEALLREATSPSAHAAAAATGASRLAAFGTPQIGVLAGVMLGAASLQIPVILDSYTTGAAAVVAASIAPTVTGYLIAGHRGNHPMMPILAHLGLAPVCDVGLGSGDGTGAAMVLPFADHIAALARDSNSP